MTQLLTKAYYSSLRLKTIISYNYYYNTQSHELIILNVHSDSEQAQLFRAAETIQGAFRKYKSRRQLRTKEKSAALLIEQYYKEYRDVSVYLVACLPVCSVYVSRGLAGLYLWG